MKSVNILICSLSVCLITPSVSNELNFGFTNKRSTTDSINQVDLSMRINDLNISNIENKLSVDYDYTSGKLSSELIDVSVLSLYNNFYTKESFVRDTQRMIESQYKIGTGITLKHVVDLRAGIQYSHKEFKTGYQNRVFLKGSVNYTKKNDNNSTILLTSDVAYNKYQTILDNKVEFKVPISGPVSISLLYKGTFDTNPDFVKLPKYFSKTICSVGYNF